MTILITERQPNRADAERCVLWLLDYYRQQALDDGIPLPAVQATTTALAGIRAELAGARPALWAARL